MARELSKKEMDELEQSSREMDEEGVDL